MQPAFLDNFCSLISVFRCQLSEEIIWVLSSSMDSFVCVIFSLTSYFTVFRITASNYIGSIMFTEEPCFWQSAFMRLETLLSISIFHFPGDQIWPWQSQHLFEDDSCHWRIFWTFSQPGAKFLTKMSLPSLLCPKTYLYHVHCSLAHRYFHLSFLDAIVLLFLLVRFLIAWNGVVYEYLNGIDCKENGIDALPDWKDDVIFERGASDEVTGVILIINSSRRGVK